MTWSAATASIVGVCKVRLAPCSSMIEFSYEGAGLAEISGVNSSRFASLSQVRLKSSEARRNSAILLPSDRLSWGSLRGPKNTSAITRMKRSSVLPSDSRIRKTTVLRSTLPLKLLKKPLATDCNLYQYKPEVRKDCRGRVSQVFGLTLP